MTSHTRARAPQGNDNPDPVLNILEKAGHPLFPLQLPE